MKRIIRWALILFALLAVLVTGLVLVIQTGPAKVYLAERLTSMLSSEPDQRFVIEGIGGWIPTDLKLARLEIGDREGTWLELENARLSWSFLDLLQGNVRIDNLSAARIRIDRLPTAPESPEEPEQPAKSSGIPGYLPAVKLHQLDIGEVILGRALIGQDAVLSVKGSMSSGTGAAKITAVLEIDRTDQGPPMSLRTRAEWTRMPQRLDLSLELQEHPNGLIAALAGLAEAGAIHLRIEGRGPMDQWKGSLEAGVEPFGTLHSGLQVGIGPELSLLADGSIQLQPGFLPEKWQGIPAEREIFHLQGGMQNFDRIALQSLRIEGAGHRIELAGKVVLSEEQFKAALNAQLEDLSSLMPVVRNSIHGSANLSGTFSGTFRNPGGSLQLKLDQFGWDRVELASAELTANATARPESTWNHPLYRIHSEGNVEIVRIPGVEPLPEKKIAWNLEAELLENLRLQLNRLSLAGTHHNLQADGQFDLKDLSGNLKARFHADTLKMISAFAGVDADGTAELRVTAERQPSQETAVADISLHLQDLSEVNPIPPELLGKKIDLTGHLRFLPGQELRVENLHLSNQFLQAEVEAVIDLERQRAEAKAKVAIPDLKPMSGIARQPVGGKVEITGTVSGPWTGFKAELKVDGAGITVADTAYDQVSSRITAENLPARPQGMATLTISQARDELKASSGFRYLEDRLELTGVDLSAPNCEVRGNLRIDLNSKLLEGVLSGKIPDLRDLGRILGQPLQGNTAFDAQLSRFSGQQNIALTIRGKGIRVKSVSLQEFSLKANFKDLYQHPQGRAELTAKTFQAHEATLDAVAIELDGNQQSITFRGTLSGRYQEKFSLGTRGNLAFQGKGKQVNLKTLQGKYGNIPFELLSPAEALFFGDTVSLDRFELRVGAGRLQGSAKLTQQSAAIDARLDGLPLASLQQFGAPPIKGTLDLAAQVSGSPSKPIVKARARVDQLVATGPDLESLPPADLDLNARLTGGRLHATMLVKGLSDQPLQAECTVPVEFSLRPGKFEIPRKSDWTARLVGNVQLQPLARMFLPEEQTVAGILKADLAARGTLNTVKLSGNVELREGRYENLDIGTLFTNISGDLALSGDRVNIEKLNANAGSDGKISVAGYVRLLPDKDFPLQMKATLSQATLLQSDLIHGTATGAIELEGNARAMEVTGNLDLTPVEIRIPDKLGPDLPELQVVEINQPGGDRQPKTGTRAGTPFRLRLRMDVNLPQRVFVRGRGLESEWAGRLKIRGTASKPAVTGNLKLVRGYLKFMSKRLDLAESSIHFTGAVPPNPILDIKAESQADDVTVRILVAGTASDPEINLESDPTLPEDEIMSRLLFGKSVAKISATQAIQIARAIRTLAGGGSSMGLMDRTRNLLGVDQLDLRQGESGASSKIGVGKYLTDDIYVDVEQGMGDAGGKVRVEMEIFPNVTVDSEVTSQSETGIGLNWKYDY